MEYFDILINIDLHSYQGAVGGSLLQTRATFEVDTEVDVYLFEVFRTRRETEIFSHSEIFPAVPGSVSSRAEPRPSLPSRSRVPALLQGEDLQMMVIVTTWRRRTRGTRRKRGTLRKRRRAEEE